MKKYLLLVFACFYFSIVYAQTSGFRTLQFNIQGETRRALLVVPASFRNQLLPIIFAYHGHGGTMQNMYRTRRFDRLWPQSIAVYPQGLNTPGQLTDPQGEKTGWNTKDNTITNRDLVFFDSLYRYIVQNFPVDKQKVFATGHSNGGGFAYLLWAKRAHLFRAFAPTATAIGRYSQLSMPKPCFHLMGEQDPLVRPRMQYATINRVKELNGCDSTAQQLTQNIQLFRGKNGNDLEVYLHAGGHTYPSEANQAIVNFFKKYQ